MQKQIVGMEAINSMKNLIMKKLIKGAAMCMLSAALLAFNPLLSHAQSYPSYMDIYQHLETDVSMNTAMIHTIVGEADPAGEYSGVVGYGYSITSTDSSAYYSFLFQNTSVNETLTYKITQIKNGMEETIYTTDVGMNQKNTHKLLINPNTQYCVIVYGNNSKDINGESSITISYVNDDCGNEYTSAKQLEISELCRGSIDCSNDVDFYSFTAPETSKELGCIVGISVCNENVPGTLEIHLFNSDMKEITEYGTKRLAAGKKARSVLTLKSGEMYYISVTPLYGNTGKYNLLVGQVADDISDGITNATSVNLGFGNSGIIQSSNDVDIFKVNTGELAGFKVDVRNTGSDESKLNCYILSSSGRVLAKGCVSGSNNNALYALNLSKNKYYYVKFTGSEGVSYTLSPSEIEYTIKYNVNGGENNKKNPHSYVYSKGVAEIAAPTRDNYEFQGWYKNSLFIGSKVTKISTSKIGNITLYAKWKKQKSSDISNLSASKVSDTSVTLKWSYTRKCDGFEVYQGDKKLATLKKTQLSYKVTGLTPAKQYKFKVRTFKKDSETSYGNFITLKQYTRLPAVNITFTKGDTTSLRKGQISLAWDKVDKANVGYEIYVSHSKYALYKKKATTSSDVTSYTLKNLIKKGYWIKIRAVMKTSGGKIVYGEYSKPMKVYAKTQK